MASAAETDPAPSRPMFSERWTYAAIVVVAVAFWALPVALSSSILNDDAELVTVVQDWRLNYDTSQPPLYGWLWLAASSVLGVSIASIQLVRIVIFALLFCAIFRLGTRLTVHPWAPYLLLASYIYFPIISWEGTHYQAHTVLLSLMTIATLLAVVEIRRAPSPEKFVLLGVVCGLGLLSKYTFAVILGSLLVAGLAVREYLQALLRPAILLAAAAMLLVVGPTLVTLFGQIGGVSHVTTVTQEVADTSVPFIERSITGAFRLAEKSVVQSLLFAVVVVLVWATALPSANLRRATSNPDFRFFAIQAVAGFGILLVIILALGLDQISSHHPTALLLSLPIVAVLAADSSDLLDRASPWRARVFLGGAVVAATVIFGALLWSFVYVFPRDFPGYEAVARAVRAAAGGEAVVIAERYRISGPLRAEEPGFEVYAADLANRAPAAADGRRRGGCVAVWWERGDGTPPPSNLVDYVEAITRQGWPEPGLNSVVVENSADGSAEPAASRVELLPAGGICSDASAGS